MKGIEKAESGKRGEIRSTTEKAKKEQIDAAFIQFSSACVDNAGKYLDSVAKLRCFQNSQWLTTSVASAT